MTANSSIDTSFDDNTKITTCKWTINSDHVAQFKALSNGFYTKSDDFPSDKNLSWFLKCYPNGNRDNNPNSCKLFLSLSSLPKQYKNITIYYYLQCQETQSSIESIDIYNENNRGFTWFDQTQLSTELDQYKSISFLCHIRILSIIDTSSNQIYSYPLNFNNVYKQSQLKWSLNEKIMNHHRQNIGSSIAADLISNDNQMFSITLYPNGHNIKREGYICLLLKALSFPINVASMKIKYTMKCPQINKTYNNTKTFSYTQCGWGPSKFCSSKMLSSNPSLDIIVDIEILECYDKNNNIIKNIKYKNDTSSVPSDDQEMKENDDDKQDTEINKLFAESVEYLLSESKCSHCSVPVGIIGQKMKCGGCKKRFYCNIECQKNHWMGGHKKECKKLRQNKDDEKKEMDHGKDIDGASRNELEKQFEIYEKSINKQGWKQIDDIDDKILKSIIKNIIHLKTIQAVIASNKSQK